jgi:DNA mismatch repair protein MutS
VQRAQRRAEPGRALQRLLPRRDRLGRPIEPLGEEPAERVGVRGGLARGGRRGERLGEARRPRAGGGPLRPRAGEDRPGGDVDPARGALGGLDPDRVVDVGERAAGRRRRGVGARRHPDGERLDLHAAQDLGERRGVGLGALCDVGAGERAALERGRRRRARRAADERRQQVLVQVARGPGARAPLHGQGAGSPRGTRARAQPGRLPSRTRQARSRSPLPASARICYFVDVRRTPTETPLMRQYLEVKERYPEAMVFFRLGDFYEMFFEDAVEGARLLGLTLTTRDKGREDAIPMCGVPHHAAQGYVAKLIELGRKVVICEQMEDPRQAKGIVKRGVTRVVTPGVVLDEEQLEAKAPCYLGAVIPAPDGGRFGLAFLDVTTGEFRATELAGAAALIDELGRVEPRELLQPQGDTAAQALAPVRQAFPRICATTVAEAPDAARDDALLLEALGGRGHELGLGPLAAAAAAAAVRYARATQPAGSLPLTRIVPYEPADFLVVDESSKANLELTRTLMTREKRGSLLGVLDETLTAMGGRALRHWLAFPLLDVAQIRRRQDAVELLVERAALRQRLRAELREIADLERLAGRARLGVATPRDLGCLRRSLERLPAVAALLRAELAEVLDPPALLDPGEDELADVAAAIARTLVDDPPLALKDGGVIRRGFSAELDELVDIREGGKGAILAIEARERERTGIGSLKVRYNRVFGYYIEVTRANLKAVPADYTRKQTLAGAERFVTPELAEYEAKVLGAEERQFELETRLFEALRREVGAAAPRLAAAGARLAALDALAALAEVAHTSGYVRPEVDEAELLELEDCRHPVVERLAAPGGFVPNDVRLDPRGEQMLVITGPNMAGKSTVLRQVALITLMAQMGGFVPAKRARLGVVDRIFTRVGASDNLARGESTFMVEMRETAAILRSATRRSLVVLDEIGRGTSTYDGVSIAWAVAEYLHDVVGAKTLFATHYHELCALERVRPRVRNYNIAVREWKEEIVFLRRLVPGGTNRSYGIQVARLAGLPRAVITRAREILDGLEEGRGELAMEKAQLSLFFNAAAAASGPGRPPRAEPPGDGVHAGLSAVEQQLLAVDPNAITPLEALTLLSDLRRRLRQGN